MSYQLFNLETMSGVHPGSRTAVMQRIRLSSTQGGEPTWARLLWYESPAACDLHLQAGQTETWQEQPLLRIENPLAGELGHDLAEALGKVGWSPVMCGSCRHWQPLADAATEDGLPLGRCTWDGPGPEPVAEAWMPTPLRRQSLLALNCAGWQPRQGDPPAPMPGEEPPPSPPPQPKRENGGGWREALRRRLFGPSARSRSRPSWGERIVERSGVGAGTEPCFACQGRIANLGALVVASPEGDKRTFSVWRCRRCHTFYLNDWTDRWERLDSLETEERYFRLAPAEALSLLALIDGVEGADHPAGRHERESQRQRVEALLAGRTPLSVQVRHGR